MISFFGSSRFRLALPIWLFPARRQTHAVGIVSSLIKHATSVRNSPSHGTKVSNHFFKYLLGLLRNDLLLIFPKMARKLECWVSVDVSYR